MCRMWHNVLVFLKSGPQNLINDITDSTRSPIIQHACVRLKVQTVGVSSLWDIRILWDVCWQQLSCHVTITPELITGNNVFFVMLCQCPSSNWILVVCNHAEWIWSPPPHTLFIYSQTMSPLSWHGLLRQFQSEVIQIRLFFCGRATGICPAGGKWWASAPWPSSSSCSDTNRGSSQWMAEEKGGVLTPGATPSLSPTLSCPWWGLLLFPTWSYCEICFSSRFKALMGSRVSPTHTAASFFFFCRSPEKYISTRLFFWKNVSLCAELQGFPTKLMFYLRMTFNRTGLGRINSRKLFFPFSPLRFFPQHLSQMRHTSQTSNLV